LVWKIEWDDRAVKDMRGLSHSDQKDIVRYLRERIATDENPKRFGKSLTREKSDYGDIASVRAVLSAVLKTIVLSLSSLPLDIGKLFIIEISVTDCFVQFALSKF